MVTRLIVLTLLLALYVAGKHSSSPPREWKVSNLFPCTGQRISVVFALKQTASMEELEHLLETVSDPSSSSYGQYFSHERLTELMAPSRESMDRLLSYLTKFGFSRSELLAGISSSKDFLSLSMSVETAQEMFKVHFAEFSHENHGAYLRSVSPITIDSEIAELVDFVGGIEMHSLPKSNFGVQMLQTESSWTKPESTPQFLKELYSVPPLHSNQRSNVLAVVEFLDQYYAESDLQAYQKEFGLARQKVSRLVGFNNESLPGGEASLDIQVIEAIAPTVTSWFMSYSGLRNNSEPASDTNQEPFLRWILDLSSYKVNPPLVYSVSYDDDEDDMPLSYAKRLNIEFIKAGLRGFTLLFAAGDDGVGGITVRQGATCTKTVPAFPTSSPYATSIGGTQIKTGTSATEVVSDSATGSRITTGGGFSTRFKRPWYQVSQVDQYLGLSDVSPSSLGFNRYGRGYPDVASMADNYPIYLGGQRIMIGGTSASTPVIGGIVAVLNEFRLRYNLPPMGFLNPWLYRLEASAFQDVTEGNNKCSAIPSRCCSEGFHASKGWDAATGLGTPNTMKWIKFALSPFAHLEANQ